MQCNNSSFIIAWLKPVNHVFIAKNKYFLILLLVSFCTRIICTAEEGKFMVIHIFVLLSSLVLFIISTFVTEFLVFITLFSLPTPLTTTFNIRESWWTQIIDTYAPKRSIKHITYPSSSPQGVWTNCGVGRCMWVGMSAFPYSHTCCM